jgi:ATP-dependent Clp protease ATP-binding subunit ClpA
VGYEEGGKLTEAVRRRPYCMVVFDELEKAHPDVCGILLQIMEEGVLTDSTGRRVSLKNAVVVMTSNVGGELKSEGLGFQPGDRVGETERLLRQRFTPEFLGRLDLRLCFRPLESEALAGITRKYLQQLQQRSAESGITLILPEELPELLSSGVSRRDGARQLRRIVQEKVESPLAVHLLQMKEQSAYVRGILRDGELCFAE